MSGAHPILTYDAEDDPYELVELAIATFDSPNDRMGFMNWAVKCMRTTDPRRIFDCVIRFNISRGICEFVYNDEVLDRYFPKGWQ